MRARARGGGSPGQVPAACGLKRSGGALAIFSDDDDDGSSSRETSFHFNDGCDDHAPRWKVDFLERALKSVQNSSQPSYVLAFLHDGAR